MYVGERKEFRYEDEEGPGETGTEKLYERRGRNSGVHPGGCEPRVGPRRARETFTELATGHKPTDG